jgi:AcrR family transcriptional regulator
MKKIEKKDWFTEGLNLLATEGFAKITIDNLCTILTVTKGSFYHHFGSIDGYINNLMKYWLKENTLSFIEKSEQFKNGDDRRNALFDLEMRPSIEEQSIRAWGYSNRTVASYVKKVDEIRLDYVAQIEEKRGLSIKEARCSAIIIYSILLGTQQLSEQIADTEYDDILNVARNIQRA